MLLSIGAPYLGKSITIYSADCQKVCQMLTFPGLCLMKYMQNTDEKSPDNVSTSHLKKYLEELDGSFDGSTSYVTLPFHISEAVWMYPSSFSN
jgi:hypothetical protein